MTILMTANFNYQFVYIE